MENILENNKLITEFLGFELFNNKYYELSQFGYMKTNGEWSDVFYPETLKFHKDWNWLVEVVEKIESIKGTQIFINGISCEIMFKGKVISKHFNTKIEAVYNACLEFIKWYNLNNK